MIYQSAATGAHAILGNPNDPNTFWGRFAACDFQRGLGLPVGGRYNTTTGFAQEFQKGTIRWTAATGTFVQLKMDRDQPQASGWDCGVSSGARLLRFYGKNVSYDDFRAVVQFSGDLQTKLGIMGATPQQYSSAMDRWIDTRVETGVALQRVIDLVQSGKPVIALIRVGEKPVVGGVLGGILGAAAKIPLLHYIVIHGVDLRTGEFLIADPDANALNSRLRMSFSEFNAQWDWHAGGVPGEILRSNNVRTRTIIF